jgi:hypothetical protein
MVSPTWHHGDGNGVHSPDATKPGHDEYERSEKTLRYHRNWGVTFSLTIVSSTVTA